MSYYELASAPSHEECVQVSKDFEYQTAMREECYKYKEVLEKRFPNLLTGMYFKIKSFNHDFGNYYEVCIIYNDSDYKQEQATTFIENNLPKKWTDSEVFENIPIEEISEDDY